MLVAYLARRQLRLGEGAAERQRGVAQIVDGIAVVVDVEQASGLDAGNFVAEDAAGRIHIRGRQVRGVQGKRAALQRDLGLRAGAGLQAWGVIDRTHGHVAAHRQ